MDPPDTLGAYLRKHQLSPASPDTPAHPELAIVVVFPGYDEPDVQQTLDSLRRCRRPRGAVEVVLVWNASEHDALAVGVVLDEGIDVGKHHVYPVGMGSAQQID